MENKTGYQELKPLVDAGGYAIFENAGRIYFVNYGTSWIIILQFVLGLLLTILSINGFVQLFLFPVAGIILIIIALFPLFLLIWASRTVRKWKNKNLEELNVTGIIDLNKKQLLDWNGKVLSPLEAVKFKRVWPFLQRGGPFLEANWPNGSVVLARPNVLSGGAEDFFYFLNKRGLMINSK